MAVGGFMILSAQGAAAAEWKLVEVAGPVRIATPGRDAVTASLGQVLPTGSNVTTGAGGRAALMNGAQRVVVGPNSRMTVAPESNPGMTRVMQDLGSILFQVDKKPSQHFRVETPLLAAVVKGTTFTVTVGPQSDAVHVAEGLVEVRAANGGAMQDLPAGATGVVSRDDPQALNVKTPTSDVSAEPVPASIEPLNYASASGGLVEASPGAGAPLASQTGLTERNSGNMAAPGDGGGVAEPGQGLQAARAAAAVIAAQDNRAAGGHPGNGGGAGGNPGSGHGDANPGRGDGGGSGNGPGGNGANPGVGNPGAGNSNGNGAGGAIPGNGSGNGNSGNGQAGGSNPGNGASGVGNGHGNGSGGGASPGHGHGDAGNGGGHGNGGGTSPGNGNGAVDGAGGPGNGNGPGGDAPNPGGGGNGGNVNSGNGNGGGTGAGNPGPGNGADGNAGGSGNAGANGPSGNGPGNGKDR